jgi:arabinofuranosyltransferase
MQGTAAGRLRSGLLPLLGAVLVLLYIAWAVPFMLESSVVAIDGRRYFGLFDDAMISMRYAWNFSHGQGLVWNTGERIEGYTNLLWTLIMSIYTGLLGKSHAVLAVQITGVALVLGCCGLVWTLTQRVGADLPERERLALGAAATVMTLLYYPLSYWALTGMETGLLTLLMLAAMYSLEGYARNRSGSYLLSVAVFLGLAYLTREDSAIFSIPILLYAVTLQPKGADSHLQWRTLLPAIGLFILFPIGHEAFRLLYYGDILPNTYYLKLTGMPLADRIRNGLGFTSLYLVTHSVFLGVCALGCALKPDRRKTLYLTLAALPILYQIWVGGDPVRIWRMMTPAQPLAAVLYALSSLELLRRMGASVVTSRGMRIFGYMVALAILTIDLIFTPFIAFREDWFPLDFYRPRINAAVAVNEVTTRDASVAVLAAGVIPYYTDRKAHDMLGKSDAYIASLPADISGAVGWGGMNSVPGHNKYDLNYSIKQLRPTYAETSKWGGQDITAWMMVHYARVNYKGIDLWLLKGSPDVKWELLAP